MRYDYSLEPPAHGLESFYRSRRDQPFSSVISRAIRFLEIGANAKEFRRRMNAFYGLRSRYVHGDLETCHPVQNERLDPTMDALRDEIFESIQFAAQVLIYSVQKLMAKGWSDLEFEELLVGKA